MSFCIGNTAGTKGKILYCQQNIMLHSNFSLPVSSCYHFSHGAIAHCTAVCCEVYWSESPYSENFGSTCTKWPGNDLPPRVSFNMSKNSFIIWCDVSHEEIGRYSIYERNKHLMRPTCSLITETAYEVEKSAGELKNTQFTEERN